EVFLGLFNVVPVFRPGGDNFNNDLGDPPSPKVFSLGRGVLVNGQVRVPFRVQAGQQDFALTARGNGVDGAGMAGVVRINLPLEGVGHRQVPPVGNINHANHSSAELVKVSFLTLRPVELHQAHSPPLVLRSDGD